MTEKNFCWLVVEDSPEDYEVLLRAINKTEIPVTLARCADGESAIYTLENFENTPHACNTKLPELILLDLNLPGTDGFDVLEKIQANEKLKIVPVVILSTSSNPTDIQKCYELGASSYIPKPPDMNSYIEMAEALKAYWIEQVKPPITKKDNVI